MSRPSVGKTIGLRVRAASRAVGKAWSGAIASAKATATRALTVGPFGLLSGIFPVMTGEPPAMGTMDLLEGHDTMPWLRALGDKVSTAVGVTDWRLYAVPAKGKAAARPAEQLDAAAIRGYVRDAIQSLVDVKIDRISGRLGASFRRVRTLQRSLLGEREKLLSARRRAGELEEIDDHAFFDMLENPNPYMAQLGLMKVTNLHLDLVGDAYWIKERNKLGTWVGSWPVPPHWVIAQPTPAQPFFRIIWRAWKVDLPLSEAVWFHEPSPVNPYARGSGVGWALGDELEVDEYAAKMAKALFFNQARPDVVVYGFDSVDEKRRLERDWVNHLQGWWRAHKPYFLTGEPKFHEFQKPNMEQLVYPNLRKNQRDIVIQTWGVPPEMFGIHEGGNLARTAYEAAEYLFGKWVVSPRAERMRGVLQREVALEYDERLILSYPSPVPTDKEYELSVMKGASWAFDADEFRARAGYGPDDVAGKGRLIPMNSYVTEDPLDQAQRPQGAGAAMRATDAEPAAAAAADEGKKA